ncbi:phosphoribosyltransferase [Arthrobacter sp. MYb227]|uniref:phosphoribosyltransferase n=1 Tax=Arthrobacter sp. MYb227 TaxID=1848601 RepID=UPI000CFB66E9|nr:phosphoribosyltransferase family protein [Arthrobacter sp. MYb227]PQZ92155.1 phosphoribosyltransferase [Arthrobacter sp. MYb227]
MRYYFANRQEAGARLADLLAAQGLLHRNAVVLGLLRGGVPVAAPLAMAARCQLGALAVRKLGFPSEPELAFGAVATYSLQSARYLNEKLHASALQQAGEQALALTTARAQQQLSTLSETFAEHMPSITGRTVIVCDDGLATGATMHAALRVLALQYPQELIIAVPVSPQYLVNEFLSMANVVLSLYTPSEFTAVGAYYQEFDQVSESAVLHILHANDQLHEQ